MRRAPSGVRGPVILQNKTPAMRVRRGGFLLAGRRYFDALTM